MGWVPAGIFSFVVPPRIGHLGLVTEGQVGEGDRKVAVQIGALPREQVVLANADEHVEIARRSSIDPARALAADAQPHLIVDPGRDLDPEQVLGALSSLASALTAGRSVDLSRP